MEYQIAELIDLPALQTLMESLHRATGIKHALIDNASRVLTAVGWEPVCTDFHRANPRSCERCRESDRYILKHLHAGPYVGYDCPNGLVDYATPLIIDGAHLANVFTGQMFHAPPDLDYFRRQAAEFGFDEAAYLAAVQRVPIVPRERMPDIMAFLVGMAQMLARQGLARLRQLEAEQELRRFNGELAQRVQERTEALSERNRQLSQIIAQHELTEAALRREIAARKALEEELERQAHEDSLTGTATRRHFLELAEKELARSRRYGSPLSFLMLDIDRFKEINDRHGHGVGDAMLRRLAEACRQALRVVDIVGRIGGDEFAVILPETDGERAREAAQRLRQAIAEEVVVLDDGSILRCTASIGASTVSNSGQRLETLLHQADDALYRAKTDGRDRVTAFAEAPVALGLSG